MRVVVIGNGMAGSRFVAEALDLDRSLDITVIGDEPGGAYNRVQLTHVLGGSVSPDTIELASQDWYAERGVALIGATATSIDRAPHARRLSAARHTPKDRDGASDGAQTGHHGHRRIAMAPTRSQGLSSARVVHLAYDVLVLATGAAPVMPDLPGLSGPGVVAFRTLADCTRIDALIENGAKRAVVLGGGVLGLETARALAGRGLDVGLMQRGLRLMERQLDASAARVLARTVADLGVRVRTGAAVAAVLRDGDGQLGGVLLDDGTVLDAEIVVVCCGAKPRVEVARAAGLAVRNGVLVDDQLRSSDPGIFAIGDCAEHRGRVDGLVAPAWAHARIAALAIARPDQAASYPGSAPVVRLKADGIELASLGDVAAEESEDGETEVIRFSDPARGVYQKLVVRDGQLVGAILLGDTRTAGTITQLFDRGSAVPADRAGLLLGRRGGAADSTVCQCNGVTRSAIRTAWQDGAREVSEIARRTRATTGCGTCRAAVAEIVKEMA